MRQSAEGHLKELNKKKPVIPSYFITNFNSLDLIIKLDSKVNGKDTWMLKQLLIKIQNKIDNINRLIELAQETEIYGETKKRKELIKELKNNTYYQDLMNLLLEEPIWNNFSEIFKS